MKIDGQILKVKQIKEFMELIGFESRNKYQIMNEADIPIAYAAEQSTGILGWVFRQFLGHWRPYEIFLFDSQRNLQYKCIHPFRFFFQKFIIEDAQGKRIGEITQQFSILSKKFEILSLEKNEVFQMQSGFFKFWTFPISHRGFEVAVIAKRWSGLLKEAFLDADNFHIEFKQKDLSEDKKNLILASAFFIDMQYFEHKAD